MSLLDLPASVRTLIYEHALVRYECPIDLSYWAARSFQTSDQQQYQARFGMHHCWRRANSYEPHNRTCVCDPLPVALLRVCRTVHAESVAVLYGGNRFVLRGRTFAIGPDSTNDSISDSTLGGNDNHYDNYRLRRLPCTAQFAPLLTTLPLYGLAHMRYLLVRLNCWPCPLGHEEAEFASLYHDNPFEDVDEGRAPGFCRFCSMRSDRSDDPLSLPPVSDKTGQVVPTKSESMIRVWDDVCARLGHALQRHPHHEKHLDLTLICDVDSVEAAERVVAPLTQAILPTTRLKACSMRLGRRRRDAAYTAVARRAVQALTTGVNVSDSEAAATTPATSTSQAVTTTNTRHIFPFRRLPAELRIKILEATDISKIKQIFFRSGRQHFRRDSYLSVACCDACTTTRMDCCCPRYYAAVSAHCKCLVLPTGLFEVDRRMYREAAQDLFYSRVTLEYHSDRFDMTLAALRRMTPTTLKTITKLKIIVSTEQFRLWYKPPRDIYATDSGDEDNDDTIHPFVWVPDHDRGDTSWALLVAFIQEHMDVSRLSIRLNLIDCVWEQFEGYLMGDRSDMRNEFQDAYTMYMDLVTELCTLKTLREFHIDISVFGNLERWFVRQVLGAERDPYKGGVSEAEIEQQHSLASRRRLNRLMPVYHDTNMRLPGSNYHPVTEEADSDDNPTTEAELKP